MKRLFALLIAICLALFAAGCQNNTPTDPVSTEPSTTVPTDCQTPTDDLPDLPSVDVDNPITYLTISCWDDAGNVRSLTAFDNDEGQVHVEYQGQVQKVGNFDIQALDGITAEFEKTALAQLNGKTEYAEGGQHASMYIMLADQTVLRATFQGVVPEEFSAGYQIMDDYFQMLTANLNAYVPSPVVLGDVNPDALNAISSILAGTGLSYLDTLYISDIPRDEFFDITIGLTDSSSVICATICEPILTTTAYSFVVITVNPDADIDALRDDLASHLSWNSWGSYVATNALIAQRDNMLIRLMGCDDMYRATATAITNAGWERIENFTNPATADPS